MPRANAATARAVHCMRVSMELVFEAGETRDIVCDSCKPWDHSGSPGWVEPLKTVGGLSVAEGPVQL